jgi:hypothetical protein
MAPPYVTGFYTIDSLVAGNFAVFAEAISHLVLPACVLGWAVMGIISRLVRASMLDVLNQDYILAARAKGASEPRVLVNHALRNALIPTLTIVGFSFAYLISAVVRDHLLLAGHGILRRRRRAQSRLSRDHRRHHCRRHGVTADEPADRHRLRVCRSAHPIQVRVRRSWPRARPFVPPSSGRAG